MFSGIKIILFYFVILVLQSIWIKFFSIFSVCPDFVLMYLIIVSITHNNPLATIFGFIFGLIYDIFLGNFFCVTAISYTIISFILGNLSKIVDHTHIHTEFVLIIFNFFINFLLVNILIFMFYRVTYFRFFEFIGCLLYSLPFVVLFHIKIRPLLIKNEQK